MEHTWHIRTMSADEQALSASLAQELNISEAAARMLVVRGLKTAAEARSFIRPALEQLHDPFLMKDMEAAVERLTQAMRANERILVYGDYDVDGTTAVALVYKFLSPIHDNIDFYIPDRYKEGYGISYQGIDYAVRTHCSLIIALDCGIKSMDHVAYAKQRGVDFIICDHHTPDPVLPAAVAVLDPKRSDCSYPFKELSGCGVGYKLMLAFAQYNSIDQTRLSGLLELLALSIASDIVPLVGENRILAFHGLKQLNENPSVGLQSIMEVAEIKPKSVTISDLVYRIGPRINASGRMKSGAEAVRLLISTDKQEAMQKSLDINNYNEERKDFDQKTTQEALEQLMADPDNEQHHTSVVYAAHWNKGVVGIVASRLTEKFFRPTIVLTQSEGDIISGSARSVGGFDLYSAIDSCRDLLTNFGGHMYAAGLSMHFKDLPEFKRRFEEYVARHILPEQTLPIINIEGELSFADIDNRFFQVLNALQPFGPGNACPVFMTRGAYNYRYSRTVGKEQEHLKLDLYDGTGSMQGIAFGRADMAPVILNGEKVDVCYRLEKNTFNDKTTLQLMTLDIKPTKNNNIKNT